MTRLFVGSEGTLGILTSVTLRLQGIPQKIGGGVCPFPTIKAACDAVIMTIQMGIPVARIGLLDALQIKCSSGEMLLNARTSGQERQRAAGAGFVIDYEVDISV